MNVFQRKFLDASGQLKGLRVFNIIKSKVTKMHLVWLALIFIFNLHIICADLLIGDLASRTTATVSSVERTHENQVLPHVQNSVRVWPPDLIIEENYPAETHYIRTEDRYVLTVFRIPGPSGSTPVFLQHGLLESSADWLLAGKGKSLAYMLSDLGYDVWLGNARGSTYSKKHETLTTSDPKFWDFSWDELGTYDLPAVITYITDLKKDSLFYIGHSMGATTFSVMATERPDVAKKIKAMIGLAPATYVYHIRAAIKFVAPFWKQFQYISNSLGIYEFFPRSIFFDNFAQYICKTTLLRNVFCSNPLFLIAGFNPEKLNYTLLPTIWSTFPAGTSIKLFTHWLQQMNVNEFRKFDYGLQNNLKIYNSTKPPNYDLSKLRVPVAVLWSTNDWLVGPQDVETFYKQVPLKLGSFKIEDEHFNHFDFLWAVDAHKLVNPKVIEIMAQYDNTIV